MTPEEKMRTTTPKAITPALLELAAKVGCDPPAFVEISAMPNAQPAHCHPNCASIVKERGGKVVYGWAFWEHPKYLQAEFHSVWQTDDGKLIDITPDPDEATQRLFGIDHVRKFKGFAIPNQYLQLVDDVGVRVAIQLWEKAGKLISQYPADNVPDAVVKEIASMDAVAKMGVTD